MKQHVQTFVDKTFYRIKYNYRLAIKDFSNAVTSAHDKDTLIKLLIKKIENAIPLKKIAVLLPDPMHKRFTIKNSHGFTQKEKSLLQLDYNDQIVKKIQKTRLPLIQKGRAKFADVIEDSLKGVFKQCGIEISRKLEYTQ